MCKKKTKRENALKVFIDKYPLAVSIVLIIFITSVCIDLFMIISFFIFSRF